MKPINTIDLTGESRAVQRATITLQLGLAARAAGLPVAAATDTWRGRPAAALAARA